MVKLVNAFDVGKYLQHDIVRKHMMFTICEYDLEMEHLIGYKRKTQLLREINYQQYHTRPGRARHVNGVKPCSAKMKISTTYQSHIYESIDLKLGQVDNVTSFTKLAKFGEDRISDGAPTWW